MRTDSRVKTAVGISIGTHEVFRPLSVESEPAVFPPFGKRPLKMRLSGHPVKDIPRMQYLRFAVNDELAVAADPPEKLDKRLGSGGNPFVILFQAEIMPCGAQTERQGKIRHDIRFRPVDT